MHRFSGRLEAHFLTTFVLNVRFGDGGRERIELRNNPEGFCMVQLSSARNGVFVVYAVEYSCAFPFLIDVEQCVIEDDIQ